ncbi:RNA binding domain protein [Ichthyophthirius multifiliis]|uniref:RNA binding domain protein n=1 Tax=Ichthyophthirius multifiliis TaxID=5932 RepID=G0R4T3_ICHMU|nr:RNA binding domain protein [Ichthyophthirius multifiliis]EGR27521.1 RNA binding domain protein [Ichthyophthirius multifiliis]|eukprot:XP_004024973.1 RNA binding domain protein [Ichthyophthirius multifiliis]
MKKIKNEDIRKIKRKKAKQRRQNEKKKEKWYNPKYNTYIYISGLPKNITIEKLDQFFSRAGVIRKDHVSLEKKIKIYKDKDGSPKGDAAISYTMIESIDLAITMLDQREIEPGYIIKVEKAQFNQHGEQYKKRLGEKQNNCDKVKKLQNQAEIKQQLGWEDEDQIDTGLKIVTIKNLFNPNQEKSDTFYEDLQSEVIQEIQNSVGPVQRFKIFENNPEGVVQIKFKNSQIAQKCIEIMNGRFFDEKQLICEYWDGVTDYKTDKNEIEDEDQRLDDFGKWIVEKNKEQL